MNFKQWIKQAYNVDLDTLELPSNFTVFAVEAAYEAGKRVIITDYEEEIKSLRAQLKERNSNE